MNEQAHQTKIINMIKNNGGWAVNGNFTLAGEPDLQCAVPVKIDNIMYGRRETKQILIYVAVEVKDEFNYHRVMDAIDAFYNVVNKKKLKHHEVLQMAKIKEIRKRGGLALVAYNYKQIMEYVDEETK